MHSVYVKREIRSLTVEDREDFLNAMHTMWKYSTKEGRKTYGSAFTGIDELVSVHAAQATGDIEVMNSEHASHSYQLNIGLVFYICSAT